MRKWPRVLIAGIIVGLLGFYPLLAPPAHRIDKDHFELVQKGMTLGEVESIFGQAAGTYDWAVPEDGMIRLWDVASGNRIAIGGVAIIPSSTKVVAAAFSSDGLWLAAPNSKNARFATTVFLGTRFAPNIHTWTGRHGTCTISFDDELRVTGKTGWGESRVEPPWSKWWKKWFGGE